MDAILLHIGEKVQRADGSYGVVVALRVVAGTAVRYNLTVHEVHTYLVGTNQWVVHNCDGTPTIPSGRYFKNEETSWTGRDPANKVTTDVNGNPLSGQHGMYYGKPTSAVGKIVDNPKSLSNTFADFIDDFFGPQGYTYQESDWTYYSQRIEFDDGTGDPYVVENHFLRGVINRVEYIFHH